MKKRICSLFVMLCMAFSCMFVFTGCNLFHDNNSKYNNQVVATVGNEEITRNDVLTWFNYYYYNAYMYYQYDQETVYQMALNNLVKFKIIINEAKNNDEIVLTVSDQNDIWKQVFKYIDQTVDTYENEIRTRYGLEEIKAEEEKTEEELLVYAPYKRAEVKYSIDYDQYDTVLNNTYNAPKKEDNYYRYLAYQKYLVEVQESANLYSNKKLTKEQAFNQELNRYYKYYENQKYVQKYNDYCLNNIVITDEAIVERYVQIINTQMQDMKANDSYISTITNSANKDLVLYHSEGGAFSVQQIVLGFNDMITVNINNSSTKVSEYLYSLDGFVFDAEEETKIEKAYVEAFLKERENYAYNDADSLDMTYIDPDTGLTTDEFGDKIEKTLDDLKAELGAIRTEYLNTSPIAPEAEKIAALRKYIQGFYKLKFSYSKDSNVTDLTSVFNKIGYVFPATQDDMTSSWVSEFTNAAYDLYDEYKATGDYNYSIFVSNYGVHIMMFTGVFEAGMVAEANIESLKNTYFSNTTDQTVADYIYDLLLNEMQSSSSSNNSYYLQAMLGENISSVLYERVTSVLYNQYLTDEKIDIKYPSMEDIK